MLAGLAAVYFERILHKQPDVSGKTSCSYAGGYADVAAKDGSIFAECGTLNPDKVERAMRAGVSLLIVPWALADYGVLGFLFEPKKPLGPDPLEEEAAEVVTRGLEEWAPKRCGVAHRLAGGRRSSLPPLAVKNHLHLAHDLHGRREGDKAFEGDPQDFNDHGAPPPARRLRSGPSGHESRAAPPATSFRTPSSAGASGRAS